MVGPDQHSVCGPLRLAELLASVSLGTDLGTGQPLGHALRTCTIATALAEALGCSPDETRTIHQFALLRFLGCTSATRTCTAISPSGFLEPSPTLRSRCSRGAITSTRRTGSSPSGSRVRCEASGSVRKRQPTRQEPNRTCIQLHARRAFAHHGGRAWGRVHPRYPAGEYGNFAHARQI
jgi:hypothetical protein